MSELSSRSLRLLADWWRKNHTLHTIFLLYFTADVTYFALPCSPFHHRNFLSFSFSTLTLSHLSSPFRQRRLFSVRIFVLFRESDDCCKKKLRRFSSQKNFPIFSSTSNENLLVKFFYIILSPIFLLFFHKLLRELFIAL